MREGQEARIEYVLRYVSINFNFWNHLNLYLFIYKHILKIKPNVSGKAEFNKNSIYVSTRYFVLYGSSKMHIHEKAIFLSNDFNKVSDKDSR